MLTRLTSRRDIISMSIPHVFLTINSIPLRYAPQNITFTPKNLKAGGLFFLSSRAMASKRIHLSSPESGFPTNKQVMQTRGLMGAVLQSENGVAKVITGKVSIADIQSMQDDPVKLEKMTVQELRTTLRSIGIAARGCKRDLVTTLKCYLNNRVDGTDDESFKSSKDCSSSEIIPSSIESDLPRKKSINAKNASDKNNIEDDNTSGFQTSRKRGKIFPAEHGQVKHNSDLVRTEQNLSIETEEVSGNKSSMSKRIVSSEIRDKTIESSYQGYINPIQTEPWTILSHMKPKKGWTAYNPKTMRPPPPIPDSKTVKLMSWNVNGIRALLKLEGFSALELAEREDFDVLCLQETKLQEKDVEAVKQCLIDGYKNSFWTCSVSKLGYSGTAIISRIKPLSVRYGFGIPDHDSEGRLVTAEFDSFYLINGYVPNSGDGLRRLSYRVTEWDPSLSNHMKELEKSKPVILTGDLNCAHQEIDIYNPAGNKRSAGFTVEERQSFEKNFLSRGFVDTFREQHPDVVGYTYWTYRNNCRKTNKGWRLDYFLVSEAIADKVHDSYILPDVIGSDHSPIGLTLKF